MTDRLRILVADDEPAMLSLNANYLRQKGYDVVEASDGVSAWETAQDGNFDLLLLDVMMPGMSGWEVCKKVKAARQDTAVVMLTGIGENLNDMTSPLYSADGWLDKPFDFLELERKIRETLEKYGKSAPSGPPPKSKRPASVRKPSVKKTTPKPAAKKPAAKKPAAKKPAAKKPAAKKPAAKKPAAKKPAAKKPAAKKPAAKKPAAKKR
ncbi:MAG: response regulator [Polyangiaceae bacterium]